MWLEQHYLSLLSSQLRNFKRSQGTVWQFACPFCGDSQRHRRKARGYVFPKGRYLRFQCHNCGEKHSFPRFLELVDHKLFTQYQFDKFKEKKGDDFVEVEKKDSAAEAFFTLQASINKIAVKMSTLDSGHEAYRYLKDRQIPIEKFDHLYYTEHIGRFVEIFPQYADTVFPKEPRIVIPIHNRQNELIGITARAYKPSNLRYIMMRRSDEEPLIFNLDKVDIGRKVYAFEGAFDSMFVENSIAVSGADFNKLATLIPKEQTVVIFDNQPRNRELLPRIDAIAASGYPMFVWPEGNYAKDFNKNIQDGLVKPEHVKGLIDENTFRGMTLKMKLADWKKFKVNAHRNSSESN